MGDGITQGRSTNLGVGQEFANAVLYCMSKHQKAKQRDDGIVLPIDEGVWQNVFAREFPNKPRCNGKPMQTLKKYCYYFNHGRNGIGLDKSGNPDFGRGDRDNDPSLGKVGMFLEGTQRAIIPGSASYFAPAQVIRLAKAYWDENGSHHDGLKAVQASTKANAVYEDDEVAEEIIRDAIRREMVIEAFERKASWARLARKLYGYECMIPGCRFELVKENGELYIEVHHIKPMFEHGSPNDKMNLSVLCPNHHREVHYAKDARRKKLTALIVQEQARRLVRAAV